MALQLNISEDAALLVVDVQEDFCPPNGALAIKNGRDIVPIINELLKLPFKTTIATQDCHSPDHISFASQHEDAVPFKSVHTVWNPEGLGGYPEEQDITLWPDHCVEGTPGCELLPELDTSRIGHFTTKGGDRRVEAYSGFGPPFRKPIVAMSDLQDLLLEYKIKRVYVCGLALDYCVKATAKDAAELRYQTFVIEDATKAVDQSEEAIEANKAEMKERGVCFITADVLFNT